MTDKQIIIDASKCEWRTGVEHCGNYECMLNKCCDYNCDWYKRRKFEQQLKRKEQECEELKKELQAQRDFTAHEQKLIYCVAYDETCKTGNDCKQEKCIFKDNIKLKQTLTEIKEVAKNSCCLQPTSDCEEYENCKECSRISDDETVKQIIQKINECEVEE